MEYEMRDQEGMKNEKRETPRGRKGWMEMRPTTNERKMKREKK